MPPKIPQSVLVVIHTPALDVLLIERADAPGFWQSVTGSKDSLDEPFELDAKGFFQSHRFDIRANLDSLEAATTGQPATLEATLGTDFVKARYDGTITLGAVPALDGTFSASSEAVSSL